MIEFPNCACLPHYIHVNTGCKMRLEPDSQINWPCTHTYRVCRSSIVPWAVPCDWRRCGRANLVSGKGEGTPQTLNSLRSPLPSTHPHFFPKTHPIFSFPLGFQVELNCSSANCLIPKASD